MKSPVGFFGLAILVNLAFLVLGLFDIFDGWPLYQIPAFQALWLLGLGQSLGIPVAGKANEFAVMPNALGWFLVVAGTLITLGVYYWLGHRVFTSSQSGHDRSPQVGK
ncbi:MAG: hypothetical protein Q8R08_02825 [bacterium]|nr:hypothetical protein [bacterium]